jgi:phosphohistidine phosphatase
MTERTLVLLRHTKAEHTFGVSDADRGLTDRGKADARAAGRWLADQGLLPDLVLCSPSRRTKETWQGVRRDLGRDAAVVYDERLYEGGTTRIIEAIKETKPEVQTLLVVAHNPTISAVSSILNGGDRGDGDLRTGGLAVHRVAGAWADCGPHTAPLTASHTARGQ